MFVRVVASWLGYPVMINVKMNLKRKIFLYELLDEEDHDDL